MASPFRVISVALKADASGYTPVLRMAAGETERFGKTTSSATKSSEKSWLSLKTVAAGAGVAIGLALLQAGRSAIEFDAKMRNVASLGGVSEKQFRSLSASVLELSKQFPTSASDLASGLYDIASSGFQGAKGIEVLTASAKAASAGLTTTANSAQAITAVLNAYGLGAGQAKNVSDSLFQTVNFGVISFEQLTGVIGDVVGTAAAAKVGIDQVGAALATVTRSGISADEAGTAVNRLLQSILKPTDAMKKALHDLGYESGEAALRQDGLATVTARLNKEAKGSVSTLLTYYGDIRASKAAFALAADGGATYTAAVKALKQAHEGAGATQRAFAEQSKAVSFQLKILVNDVSAAGIVLGTKFLPYITSGINGLRSLGHDALPYAKDRVGDLGDALGNLRKSLEEAWNWTGDLVTGLGQIGGSAVLGGIAGITSGLAGLTGELSKYPVLVHTITAAFLLWGGIKAFDLLLTGAQALYLNGIVPLANSLVPLGTRLIAIYENTQLVAGGFLSMGQGAVASGEVSGAAAAQISSGFAGIAAAIGPAVVAVAALTLGISAFQKAKRDAATGADDVATWQFARFDDKSLNNIKVVNQALSEAKSHVKDAQDQLNRVTIGPTATRGLQNFLENVTSTPNRIETARGSVKRYREEVDKWSERAAHFRHNTKAIREETGQTTSAILRSANSIGVDLTNATQKDIDKVTALTKKRYEVAKSIDVQGVSTKRALSLSDDELQKLSDLSNDMAAYQSQVGLLGPIVVAQKNQSVDALKDLADKAKKYIDGVQQTFSGYGDIISKLGTTDASRKEISGFYTFATKGAKTFLADIKSAVAQGLDPRFIARALEAGPEQAGPLLDAIVSKHSKTIIKMVNDNEAALAAINLQAAENARLTEIAVDHFGTQTAKDLSTAMQIAQIIATNGGNQTGAALAHALHMKESDVERVAAEYGFILAVDLNKFLAQLDAQAKVHAKHVGAGGVTGPGHTGYYAEGGYIDPAVHGDTRRDSVPAMVMPGEVIVRRTSVAKFGARNVLDLNKGKVPDGWQVPGYAGGGMVTPESIPHPPNMSAWSNVGNVGARDMSHKYMGLVDFMKKQQMAADAFASAAATGGGGAARALGQILLRQRGWSQFWGALDQLWTHESGWNPTAQNPTSSAFGIPQFLDSTWGSVGGHKTTDPRLQIQYGLQYIAQRYGDPAKAWNFWQGHHYYGRGGQVLPVHSYDRGGYLPPGLSLAKNGTGRPEPVGPAATPTVVVHFYVDGDEFRGMTRTEIEVNNQRIEVEARTR
jgi:TP901 family phage tail tape measure protein